MQKLVCGHIRQHIFRRIYSTVPSDPNPEAVEVSIRTEGINHTPNAVVSVGGTPGFDGQNFYFVIERVMNDDHGGGEFDGVTESTRDGWTANVHQ